MRFGRSPHERRRSTAWHGSQTLANLNKGGSSFNYVNSLRLVTDANTLIQQHERSGVRVDRVWLSQGESNSPNWANDFASYKANYLADIPPITGQVEQPQFFVAQTNTIRAQFNANWQGQNAVHDSGAAIMLSSRINLPLHTDLIHPTAKGTLIEGDQDAHALACLERDGTWHPPREISAALAGTVLTLRVQVPRDTSTFGRVLDRHAPPQQPQDGFRVTSGSGDVAISSVAYSVDPLTGDGLVVIQLAGAPGANPKLRYGIDHEADYTGAPQAWACRSGNVFCTTAMRSFWARAGADVPRHVRHPLRRFELAIS